MSPGADGVERSVAAMRADLTQLAKAADQIENSIDSERYLEPGVSSADLVYSPTHWKVREMSSAIDGVVNSKISTVFLGNTDKVANASEELSKKFTSLIKTIEDMKKYVEENKGKIADDDTKNKLEGTMKAAQNCLNDLRRIQSGLTERKTEAVVPDKTAVRSSMQKEPT